MALLSACATAVSGATPGEDDGGDPPAIDAGRADASSADAASVDAALADAAPPDAAPIVATIVGLSPSPVVVARGKVAMVMVTINQPAHAGGEVIELAATSGTAATLPATVMIPEGATSASFDVSGVAYGGPFDLTASLGAGHSTVPLRIVPGVASISPSASDVTVGETAHYTLALEAAAPAALDVALVSAAPNVAGVSAKITVPTGQTSVGFDVTGVGLGGPVVITASLGGASATAKARALGVFLSEILYDVTSTDTNFEWVELYNASSVAIDISGLLLQSAGGSAGTSYTTSLTLSGTLAPHQCAVVGGPSNVGVSFFQAADFNPDLGNASSGKADGIRLATASGGVVDAVLYGAANTDMITDADGTAATPQVGAAPADQTIERTAPGLGGPWQIQATPSPGNCTPVSQ